MSSTAVVLAPAANAGVDMFAIGVDIDAGEYTYRVVGADWGSWKLCSNPSCDFATGLIDMDVIDGEGHTGHLTVPASAKYLKTENLQLTPT
jgi:hypothetical protein